MGAELESCAPACVHPPLPVDPVLVRSNLGLARRFQKVPSYLVKQEIDGLNSRWRIDVAEAGVRRACWKEQRGSFGIRCLQEW